MEGRRRVACRVSERPGDATYYDSGSSLGKKDCAFCEFKLVFGATVGQIPGALSMVRINGC